MDSKVVRADFGSGLICPRAQTCMDSKVVRADFGSGLICPRAQTCMGSNMVRAVFWQRTDLPPGSNMLRLAYADSGSACKLAGVQISLLPTLANQILARTFFRSVVHLFACSAVEKFCRASSAGGRRHMQERWRIKFSLERFSDPSCFCVRAQPLESSLGRVPQAADGTCVKIS